MSDAIVVNNLWKKYTIGQSKKLVEVLPSWLAGQKPKNIWALKNINLRVKKGERVGIIGPNGSGKSTLLKILAGTTSPTKGTYITVGTVASLLELGTGFHPDLTGSENIYLYGALLGLKRSQVRQKFTRIVSFSGIKKFLDTPVKHYSSGMYVRLAFSVAVQLESDTLLVDEVLAVGDAQFQNKSLAKLEEITKKEGRTIVIVSHSMETIKHFCDRVYLLDKGKIKNQGGASNVTKIYLSQVEKHSQKQKVILRRRKAMHLVSGNTYKNLPLEKTETFTRPDSIQINQARLKHLQSLNLPLRGKRVLDVGSGIGILSQLFVKKKCDVICLDARKSNIQELQSRYPHLKAKSFVVNVETNAILPFGMFDIIFCYGLLYHLENPAIVLKKLGEVCGAMLLLESCITDHPEPFNLWVEETYAYNQALRGIGCRPTASFIISALHQAGFSHVYFPKTQPKHKDFQFDYKGDFSSTRNNHLLRQIFIATKRKLNNSKLKLVSVQKNGSNLSHQPQFVSPFTKQFLSALSEKKLLQLTKRLYTPRPLLPIPGWFMGKLELEEGLNGRYPLKLIWEKICRNSKKTQKQIQVSWYNNLELLLYPQSEISRAVFIEGCYEPNEFFFLANLLKAGMTFIDVGANTGLYTLFAASLVGPKGKVLAIEPSQREYKRLVEQVRHNKLTQVCSRRIATSNRQSHQATLSIAQKGHEGHNTLGSFVYDEVSLKKKEIVSVETLDNLVKQEKITQIDVIKIDVEGAELLTLQGAKHRLKVHRPIMLIELSDRALQKQGGTSTQVWDFLTKLSYTIYQFDPQTGKAILGHKKTFIDGENIAAVPKEKKLIANL